MITYRKAKPEDVRPALELALRVFMEYEAPEYEPEGVTKFREDIEWKMANENLYISGERLMLVAVADEKIVGMIESNRPNHINMVFVDGEYHRQGIATAMMEQIVCILKLHGSVEITINSSPYGLPFYLHFGFVPTDTEQHKDGFIFTPMTYTPNEIWDVLDKDGNKTGRYHERGRPMATGDYHLCVHVWKHNGRGEWLIDKRAQKSPDDICGGKWETTGGAAIVGEDGLTAALRETKEELGLDLDPAKGVLFRRFAREGFYGHTYLMDVWVFEHDCATRDVRFGERETCEVMWANADKIRELIRNNKFFSDVDLYFDEMVEKYTPYYLAYERRYQSVYATGAKLWGHSADDEVLNATLTEWVEKNGLRGKKVIEYACGEGSVGLILSKLGCIYHGVDIAPSAIEQSRKVLEKHPNATVSLMNMVNERTVGIYDAAVDSMGLHMLVTDDDRKKYLNNVNASLCNDAPALFFRESYRKDLPSYSVDSIEQWVAITGEDYQKLDVRQVVNDDVTYTVEIPLVPARAKNKADYIKEMNEAGFVVEDFIEMDTSNAIVHSATLYVRKGITKNERT